MPEDQSTKIGHLVDVTAGHFDARLISEDEEFVSERMFGMNKVRIGQVGSYLTIRQGDSQTLVMVERLWRDTDKHGHLSHMVRLTPLGEITKDGTFSRGVAHFPTTVAELHVVSNWDLERIFSEHSEVGYKVGRLTSFDAIDVYLDASAFFGRHAAILGQTGSGKSWTVTSLVQSALRSMPRAHIMMRPDRTARQARGSEIVKKTRATWNSRLRRTAISSCSAAADRAIAWSRAAELDPPW